MKIIKPLTIGPDRIGYQLFNVMDPVEPFHVFDDEELHVPTMTSNVPEDDEDEWNELETYSPGEKVMHNHRIYQAVAETTGDDPSEPADIPKWLDLGVTNRWRMFDEKVGTQTVNPESIEVAITPLAVVDSVAFFNITASAINVKVIDPYDGIIFNSSVAPVSTDGIDNWYDYFFAPIVLREDLVVNDIPTSKFGTIEISIENPDRDAKAGAVILGQGVRIGCAEYGSSVGIVDYSQKGRDAFGNPTIVERAFSKRAEFDVAINTSEVSAVQRLLAQFRARPIVWIGAQHIEATVIYGYYKDFMIVISNPSTSDCSISVEGLI